jgi:hypothetical protein
MGSVWIAAAIVFMTAQPVRAQISGDTVFFKGPPPIAANLDYDTVTFNALGFNVIPSNSGAANLAVLNNLVTAVRTSTTC